jgi:hypothetical protein
MNLWDMLFGGGGNNRRGKPSGARRTNAPQRPQRAAAGATAIASAQSRTCADCGATFPQSTGFCPRCGKVFGGGATSPSRPATIRPGESVAKAVQLYNESKVEEAIVEVKRLIEANPKHATAYGSLGYFLLQERRFDEAVEPMLRALELNPDSKETALHLRDVIDAYAEELIGICAADGFVSEQGGGKFDENRRHRRAREIGATLARVGDSGVFGESGDKYTSDKLMAKVMSEVQVRMSFRPETNALRQAWEGIGAWKAA